MVWYLLSLPLTGYTGQMLMLNHGYLWDPNTCQYFMPRGFAYQTFNPPVGANQTFEQLEYDLVEFKKMHANSVRAEFVWNTLETSPGVYDWSKPDFLVSKARELGLRLFVLIGFQYAPGWFPDDWKAINDHWQATNGAQRVSVVLNYEHPQARAAYSNFVFTVTKRYQNSPEIAAWILGNEYAYFDLWNPDHRYLGFDPYSLASCHQFLASRYNDIQALNATWGSHYASFAEVPMFREYPRDRKNAGYHDLTLWREHSIAEYVALGAEAAKLGDPHHLRTYSMIGSLFIGNDANYTCEDAKTIVAACARRGAPLDFWAINNYAWATFTGELRSVDFGIAKHLANSGLPILITETGHSTTDDLLLGSAERQPKALIGAVWESLLSGAIGVHVFTWNDRDAFAGVFVRERGFGVVQQNRYPKTAYTNLVQTFQKMETLQLERLLPGSSRPSPDIALYWPKSAAMGWPRANQENAMLWGTLRRLGYQLTMLDDQQLALDRYTNSSALLLSRCYQMEPEDLDRVATKVVQHGIHIHANADLPGQFNTYGHPNTNWADRMGSLFGVDVSLATPGLDSGVNYTLYAPLALRGVGHLGVLTNDFTDSLLTWKIWHGINAGSGTTIVTHTGVRGSQPAMPALQVKDLGKAKSALNTFGLGDLNYQPSLPDMHDWDLRYSWLHAIYHDYFGLTPVISLTGVGANYVQADYRICANGSVLIGLLNEATQLATLSVGSVPLLAGKTIENLTKGGIIEVDSDGIVPLVLAGDDYVWLYAYTSKNGVDQSQLNLSRNKLWISDAPLVVWPTGSNYSLTVSYDLQESDLTLVASLERVLSPNLVYAQTNAGTLSGRGTVRVQVPVPDPDLNDPWYVSSRDGGNYVFHASLLQSDNRIADDYQPVRLLWAARPLSLPSSIMPGTTYPITVQWQEIPGWLPSELSLPLDRIRLWQPYLSSQQYYKAVLQLFSAGEQVVVQEFPLNNGTDQHTFSVTVPKNATGPFDWLVRLETAPNASVDMLDSFEDRQAGADPASFAPWELFLYAERSEIAHDMFFAAGINTNASDGSQAIFAVVTNPPAAGQFSGFFLSYTYPSNWALPRDLTLWTNYNFAFDFKEAERLATILEMQIQDARGGQLHYTKTNLPASNGWDTIAASLSDFTSPTWVGHFDPDQVSQLHVNVQMQQTGVTYLGSVDNVRFVGPKTLNLPISTQTLWDTFDNRDSANGPAGWAALEPWTTYVYPGPNTREMDRGIMRIQGLKGGQAAMLVVDTPAGVGPVSTFGLYRDFDHVWSLPIDTNAWDHYVFSFDFREGNGLPCLLELQIKSSENSWIEFRKPFLPGPGGWDTVRASLAEFNQPEGILPFDPSRVQGIALNIRALQEDAVYIGFFDNACFAPPETPVASGTPFGHYESRNDSTPGPPSLQIQSVHYALGQVRLSWTARADRTYTVECQNDRLLSESGFRPLLPWTNLTVLASGPLEITDPDPPSVGARFYRIRAQPR